MHEIIIDGVTYAPKSDTIAKDGLVFSIVRTYSAGVWAGWIDDSLDLGRYVFEARRLYRWDSQFTLSELATLGVREAKDCKFAMPVYRVGLTQVIEVIACTTIAKESIDKTPVYIP